MEHLKIHSHKTSHVFHLYQAKSLLIFFTAILVGALVAYAEEYAYLPTDLSTFFDVSCLLHITGPCLSQSFIVPLIFMAGINRATYRYTSRIIFFLFFMLRGADAFRFLFASSSGILLTFLFILLLVLILLFCLRINAVGIAGASLHPGAGPSRSPWLYFVMMIKLWGELLILLTFFYILITM